MSEERIGAGASKVPVYSPDVQVFSFEGYGGLFSILSSILVAPIRCTFRVMHNIALLPAPLLKKYSISLMVCSVILFIVGAIDYLAFYKWPMLAAEAVSITIAAIMYGVSRHHEELGDNKRVVDIDTERIEAELNALYDELDKAVK